MDWLPNNVPTLGSGSRVAIADVEVWPIASVQVIPGGIAHIGGDLTLQAINVNRGLMVLIPYPRQHLEQLIKSLQAALDAYDDARTR